MRSKIIITLIFCMAVMDISVSRSAEPAMAEYTVMPVFVSNSATPNIDNSISMNFQAYDEGFSGVPYNDAGRVLELRVNTSSDDAEETMTCTPGPCVSYTQGLDLDLGMDSAEYPNQLAGIRFNSVTLEPGDQIQEEFGHQLLRIGMLLPGYER